MADKTPQERLDELLKQFPEDKFFQVFPRLILGAKVPDFITFNMEVVGVNPDPDAKEVYWQDKPRDAYGQREADEGWVALTKGSLNRLALAMGVKWLGGVRLDDGSDPNRMIWEHRAALVLLSGIDTFAEAYELNLETRRERFIIKQRLFPPKADRKVQLPDGTWRPWGTLSDEQRSEWLQLKADDYVLQMKDSFTQRVQTGAKNRIIRSITGLPEQYRPSVLRARKFAVLKLSLVPESPQERLAYIGHLAHAGALGAGYPQGAPALPPGIPGGPARLGSGEIHAETREISDELEDELDEGDPGLQEPQDAEIVEDAAPEVPAEPERPGPAPGSAQVFRADLRLIFNRLQRLIGKPAATDYLARQLFPHKTPEEVVDLSHRKNILERMEEEVQRHQKSGQQAGGPDPSGSHAPSDSPSQGPPDRFQDKPFLAIRYESLKRMDFKRLEKEFNELSKGYPMAQDPANITELLGEELTAEVILEAAIRVVEWKQSNPKSGRN